MAIVRGVSRPLAESIVQPAGLSSLSLLMQLSSGCASRPLVGSRVNQAIEESSPEVTYTLVPSGLTATLLGPSRPSAVVQRESGEPGELRQPIQVSRPVEGSREKIVRWFSAPTS